MLASNLFGTVTALEASQQAEDFPHAVPFDRENTQETNVLTPTVYLSNTHLEACLALLSPFPSPL